MDIFSPSPTFVDAVINHPTVRATAQAGQHRLFAGDLMLSPATKVVAFEAGVALFRRYWDTWDGHIFVLPSARGRRALAFGKAALAELARHPAGLNRLHTGVPMQLPAARMYCRRLGLKPDGRDLFNEYFTTEISLWAV